LVVNFITQPGTEARAAPGSRSVLATILFTDIVDSTSRASEMGDKAWRELLRAHDATVRRKLPAFAATR
jgi:class 3 adenylate cyclase